MTLYSYSYRLLMAILQKNVWKTGLFDSVIYSTQIRKKIFCFCKVVYYKFKFYPAINLMDCLIVIRKRIRFWSFKIYWRGAAVLPAAFFLYHGFARKNAKMPRTDQPNSFWFWEKYHIFSVSAFIKSTWAMNRVKIYNLLNFAQQSTLNLYNIYDFYKIIYMKKHNDKRYCSVKREKCILSLWKWRKFPTIIAL